MGSLKQVALAATLGLAGCGPAGAAEAVTADVTGISGGPVAISESAGPEVILPDSDVDPWAFDARALVVHRRVAGLVASLLEQGFGARLVNEKAGSHSEWLSSCDLPRGTALYTRHAADPVVYGGDIAAPKTTTGDLDEEDLAPARTTFREVCLASKLDNDWTMVIRATSNGHIETYFDYQNKSVPYSYPPRRLPLLTPDRELVAAIVTAGGCTSAGHYRAGTFEAETCPTATALAQVIDRSLAPPVHHR
jgi:hypothetical protein